MIICAVFSERIGLICIHLSCIYTFSKFRMKRTIESAKLYYIADTYSFFLFLSLSLSLSHPLSLSLSLSLSLCLSLSRLTSRLEKNLHAVSLFVCSFFLLLFILSIPPPLSLSLSILSLSSSLSLALSFSFYFQ